MTVSILAVFMKERYKKDIEFSMTILWLYFLVLENNIFIEK